LPKESVAFTLIVLELATVGDAGTSACFARVAIAPGDTLTAMGAEDTEPILATMLALPTGPTALTTPAVETVATPGAELV
jgi:hypothetical protein